MRAECLNTICYVHETATNKKYHKSLITNFFNVPYLILTLIQNEVREIKREEIKAFMIDIKKPMSKLLFDELKIVIFSAIL